MVRILHAADLHLDSPFTLHSPREAERRRTELRSHLSSLALYIRNKKVQICLLAGDLFDCESVTPETLSLMERELSACPECFFFISPGNHDPLTWTSPYRRMHFPENVHIFTPQKERVRLDALGVDVYGFAFDGKNGSINPLTGYQTLDPSRINLLCCHGELDGPANGWNGSFSKADLASSGFDYVALGHIHKGTGVQCENGVYWTYPGCIEGRGFDETGYKGVLYGTVGKGACEMQFVPFSKRRYEIVDCDIDGCDRVHAFEKIGELARSYGEDTALRIRLTGAVKSAMLFLPEEIGVGAGYPYLLEIKDNTFPAPDYTSLEQSGTLEGVFYRLMIEKIKNGDDDPELLRDALKYGLLALQNRNVADLDFSGFEGGVGR